MMTARPTQPRWGIVLLFGLGRWAKVAFHNVSFKTLLCALDAISPVGRLKLFRHLPHHHEERDVCPCGFVFYRLSDFVLETHDLTFSRVPAEDSPPAPGRVSFGQFFWGNCGCSLNMSFNAAFPARAASVMETKVIVECSIGLETPAR
jgi:hypothetical protein